MVCALPGTKRGTGEESAAGGTGVHPDAKRIRTGAHSSEQQQDEQQHGAAAATGRKLRRAADLLPKQPSGSGSGGREPGTAGGTHAPQGQGRGADDFDFCQEAADTEGPLGDQDGYDESGGAQYEEYGLGAGADYEEA
jgi:hypothetical protein